MLTKSFSQNVQCIWPDADDITASGNLKSLLSLAKDISKPLTVRIMTQGKFN